MGTAAAWKAALSGSTQVPVAEEPSSACSTMLPSPASEMPKSSLLRVKAWSVPWSSVSSAQSASPCCWNSAAWSRRSERPSDWNPSSMRET